MHPHVSVMMPCYNAATTLPWALASLIAQTYENWECVFVDDGSTDSPRTIIDGAGDPRIRYIGLDRNRGRGYARKVALEHARGELLCMLDADDWLFPSKLGRQVEVMNRHPELALLGTGMSIVDARGEVVGVRARGPAAAAPSLREPSTKLAPPSIAFPPCMIRMELAKRTGFDGTYPTCEDTDFLIRLLMGRSYSLLHDVSYVYSEHASVTLDKVVEGFRTCRLLFKGLRGSFPIQSRWNVGKTFAKEAVYRGASALGLWTRLLECRSVSPTEDDVVEYRAARRDVGSVVAARFRPADLAGLDFYDPCSPAGQVADCFPAGPQLAGSRVTP